METNDSRKGQNRDQNAPFQPNWDVGRAVRSRWVSHAQLPNNKTWDVLFSANTAARVRIAHNYVADAIFYILSNVNDHPKLHFRRLLPYDFLYITGKTWKTVREKSIEEKL